MTRRIALALVAGAHGVKGELRLKLFADSIDSLARHSRLYVGGRELALRDIKHGGKTAIARFEGISDRSAAEALRGQLVEIDRSELPELEEGEYYHADLIGRAAVTTADEPLGRVTAIHNFGAGDIIEIAPPLGPTMLLPFTNAVVPTVDLAGGRVVIELPQEVEGDDVPTLT